MSKFALEKAAQAWCTPETEHLQMIPELAQAFADIIDKILGYLEDDEVDLSMFPEDIQVRAHRTLASGRRMKARILESERQNQSDTPNTCRDCAGSKFC